MSGIPSWATVGMKVVCVTVPTCPPSIVSMVVMPVAGDTYTLRRVRISGVDGKPYVLLAELVNASIKYEDDRFIWTGEPQFGLVNFRPLTKREREAEDLAHFRHHLTQKIPEDAL